MISMYQDYVWCKFEQILTIDLQTDDLLTVDPLSREQNKIIIIRIIIIMCPVILKVLGSSEFKSGCRIAK